MKKNKSTLTQNDLSYAELMEKHYKNSHGTNIEKLSAFTRFVSRQNLSIFLSRHEIFKKILNVQGSIVECGVFRGAGLFTWAQLSAIYEPINHKRKIIGFDTFQGFPNIAKEDKNNYANEDKKAKGYKYEFVDEIEESANLYNINRPLGHMTKVELIKGDATKTIPDFIEQNKHLVVALLYLDFDIYAPTKVAIENFIDRIPKGGIIAFDELDDKRWPGETIAVLETIGLKNLSIKRFPFVPEISYAVLE